MCFVIHGQMEAAYTAYLPQWTSPSRVPASLVAWWQQELEHIRWHEEQHIRIFVKYVGLLSARIDDGLCSEVQGILNQWNAELYAEQHAFDVQDQQWQSPAYPGPWQW